MGFLVSCDFSRFKSLDLQVVGWSPDLPTVSTEDLLFLQRT